MTVLYLVGFIGLLCAALVGRLALLEFRRDRIPVLNYHRVVSDRDISRCARGAYVVSETEFEKQMCHLKDRGFTAIDLDDYLYYREHRSELPPKPIIITFDDGYENNYLYAYPALKRMRIQGGHLFDLRPRRPRSSPISSFPSGFFRPRK